MVSEGLAEILHAAARGERITCLMLNNGVFGDTGGQMTAATTVVGQRTKTSLEGRDRRRARLPDPGRRHLVATLARRGLRGRGAVEQAPTPSHGRGAILRGRSSRSWPATASRSSRC